MGDVLLGAGLGLLVALQVGPMTLLLVRTTLRSGLRPGLGVGCGIALVDTVYAGLGAAGLGAVLVLPRVEVAVGTVGAVVLVVLGTLTLRSALRPPGESVRTTPTTFPAALRLAVLATAANPLTIGSWAGAFAAASVGADAARVPLVTGVGLGSLAWVTCLALATAAARRALTPAVVRAADVVAGGGLVVAGLVLGRHVLG
ncbi:MAG: leucine export protein LeuE [Frankiales bacterium]|nr:leucine export protein LeuE [Frankiales bacterium]